MLKNISSSLELGEQKVKILPTKNESKTDMGLTYALGPYPDEPILSTIDRALLLSSSFRRNSNEPNKPKTVLLNSSFGTGLTNFFCVCF